MRYKIGRKWSDNEPRHLGHGEVAWEPNVGGAPGMGGRHTQGHAADEESRRDSLQHENGSSPELKGVVE